MVTESSSSAVLAGKPETEHQFSTHVLRRRGVLAAFFIGAYLLFGAHVADSALPTNSFELPGAQPEATRQVVPEGWAFFTRDPREADLAGWLDVERSGAWAPMSTRAHASAKNLLGISRRDGALSIEMGLIYSTALENKAVWNECTAEGAGSVPITVRKCLNNLEPVVVDNQTPGASLCGRFAISRQEPLPWAWASEGVDEQMPIQAMRMEVRCVGSRP